MNKPPERREVAAAVPALLLGACATVGLSVPPADPEVARLSAAVGERAAAFYAGLPARTAPDCGFAAGEPTYAAMRADAAALAGRVPGGDGAMRRAAAGLTRAVAAAERSHRLASETTDDPSGPCLAPGAITLNADAVARATKAVADLQRERTR